MITGRSPNTVLPTDGKMVKLCRKVFVIKALMDSNPRYFTIGVTDFTTFEIDSAEIINKSKLSKRNILPATAMKRNSLLFDPSHKKVRNSEGTIEITSKTENR